jgi:hypothetical protein
MIGGRCSKPVPLEMRSLADELFLIGAQFAHMPPEKDVLEAIPHASDFSWMIVSTTRYEFSTPRQRQVIHALFTEWERVGRRDGSGLHAAKLGEMVQFEGQRFRVEQLFANHPALNTILRRAGKGIWALYLQTDHRIPTEYP